MQLQIWRHSWWNGEGIYQQIAPNYPLDYTVSEEWIVGFARSLFIVWKIENNFIGSLGDCNFLQGSHIALPSPLSSLFLQPQSDPVKHKPSPVTVINSPEPAPISVGVQVKWLSLDLCGRALFNSFPAHLLETLSSFFPPCSLSFNLQWEHQSLSQYCHPCYFLSTA